MDTYARIITAVYESAHAAVLALAGSIAVAGTSLPIPVTPENPVVIHTKDAESLWVALGLIVLQFFVRRLTVTIETRKTPTGSATDFTVSPTPKE